VNPKQAINFDGLAALIRGHRESLGLTLREAAKQCCVSSSTLSRLERGEARPDLDTVRLLVDWVGVPLARVASPVEPPLRKATGKHKTPLSEVEIQFRADPNLDPKAAEALIRIVREAYQAMVSGKSAGDV
jgi:transcriptional regulator with XRE-family HTH domain